MTIAVFGFTYRSNLPFRCPIVYCVHKVRHSSSFAVVESLAEPVCLIKQEGRVPITSKREGDGDGKTPEWKKLNSKDLGIRTSMISKPTRLVLNGLRKEGYEVYLVGGCVRDLILKRIPKDFDIITSAELKEVLRTFPRCEVVGRRFPICHVHVNNTIVEVSSFSTSAKKFNQKNYVVRKAPGCNEHDYIRWRNCLQRDFTINGLMFDPYAKTVYDYMGGMEDIRIAKLRTVIPADMSFVEDCARMLRAVRIAARLGFRFTRELARSLREQSCSILRLDKGRILMEMNYMLAFGSGEASMRLLWKFGLLEILLPIQASYFVSQGFRRRDKGSNMLLSMFANLDKLVAPDRPCHCSLWIGLLAFHMALVEKPRDPLVVAAFCLAVHNGGSLSEAIDIAKRISQPHDATFNELLQSWDLHSEDMLEEVIDLARSVKASLCKMTNEYFVSQAMIKYPQAPRSDMVFISLASSLRVCKIFECVRRKGMERGFVPKQNGNIDYDSLAMGNLYEVRHVFARIVFDTVYPPSLNKR